MRPGLKRSVLVVAVLLVLAVGAVVVTGGVVLHRKLFPEPAAIDGFTLVPMSDRPIAELEGIAPELERRFPGFRFTVGPLEALPEDVVAAGGQVRDEAVIDLLRQRPPGTIAILTDDLTGRHVNFLFGKAEIALGLGVVSVHRFRDGAPGPVSGVRLANQLTSTIAKLLGMRHLSEDRCVMRFPNNLAELDRKGSEFCPRHQEELALITRARNRP